VDYYDRSWEAINTMLMQNPVSLMWMYRSTNMIPDVDIENVGLYADYEWPLAEKFTLRGGVRGDFTWNEANTSNALTLARGNNSDYQEISANLQLTYAPTAGLEIFTGLGRGVRTPDPQELYMYLQNMQGIREGNPTLDPTINHQVDLGVKYATDRFYANASLFFSDLQDFINYYGYTRTVNGSSVNVRSYQNVHATLWGAEFGSQVSLPYDLYLRGSLSYAEGENQDANQPLAEIPPLRGTVALRYDVDSWFLEIAEHLSARQTRVDPNLQESSTAGWGITDLKGGFKYKAFALYAGVNNLFDKFYYNYLSYSRDPFASGYKVPENGRNFYVTASYRF
jgi:iron complex outermembrane receptor protein